MRKFGWILVMAVAGGAAALVVAVTVLDAPHAVVWLVWLGGVALGLLADRQRELRPRRRPSQAVAPARTREGGRFVRPLDARVPRAELWAGGPAKPEPVGARVGS